MSSIYKDLPSVSSIRLLRLHPGLNTEPLSYSLVETHDYRCGPEYVALSYCWGDANDTVETFCDGKSFPITKSLKGALCQLRQQAITQLIWADAISINQENISERNQQVSIMAQIYQRASRVFIWVGNGDEESAMALDLIRAIGYGCCMEMYGHGQSPQSCLDRLHQETNVLEPDWRLIWRFYQHCWFTRAWVIQEVRSNEWVTLLCGKAHIEWDFVGLASNWISHCYEREPTVHWRVQYFPSFGGFHNSFFMWDRSVSTRREAPFPALLNLSRHFDATDPRDKVFALLQTRILQIKSFDNPSETGLWYPSNISSSTSPTHLGIRADYNMTALDVYRDLVLKSIERYDNLEVLCYAQQCSVDSNYPSWVPRWGEVNPFDNYTPLLPFIFDASKGRLPITRLALDRTGLMVQGLNLGHVVNTSGALYLDALQRSKGIEKERNVKEALIDLSKILVLDRWETESGLENSAQRTQDNLDAHLAEFSAHLLPLLEARKKDGYFPLSTSWCDICRGAVSEKSTPTTEPPAFYACSICELGDFMICTSCYDSGTRCKDDGHELKFTNAPCFWCPYTEEVILQLKIWTDNGDGARFYVIARNVYRAGVEFLDTTGGWRGAGTSLIQPGDVLAVLFGSRVPFVLRESGGSYRLIGHCYVHGIMDGEAIQMWNDGILEATDFVLC